MQKFKLLTHILIMKILIKNFLKWIIGVSFEHEKKLKIAQQCIFVANHNSHLDTASFLSILPTERFLHTHPVAAKDYFSKYRPIEILVKFIFNIILLERKGSKNAENPLQVVSDTLKKGHSILYFPEGSRGTPEVLGEFKIGIAILLKEFPQVPFVPIYMRGLGKAMPKGDPMLIPHESKIIIGEPTLIPHIETLEHAEIVQIVRSSIARLQDQA